MSSNRRCFICNKLLDPESDEGVLLMKGVGSHINNLRRLFWLCPKHGARIEASLTDARQTTLQPNKYGKITASNAASTGVK